MKTTIFKLISILLCIHASFAWAQTATIRGRVTDGETPLPFASVVLKQNNQGSSTDANGEFTITDVNAGTYDLVISFIGYETQTKPVTVTEGQDLNLGSITLVEGENVLDDVVVTALGIKREEKALGYSVSNIKNEELTEAKETNIVNALNGKVAGVQITNGSTGVGSTSRIVIRGEGSLTGGNNQPLFVVDGIPIDNNTTRNGVENAGGSEMQEVDYGNGAADINPDDIESISVLKGANAAALYGSRGANGVILITTKSGKGEKNRVNVTINTGFTAESVLRLPEYQNKYGQGWAGEFEYVDGLNNNLGSNDQEDVSWGPQATGQSITQFDSPTKDGVNRAGDIFNRGWVRNPDGSITSPTENPNDLVATPFKTYKDNVKDFFKTGYTKTVNASVSVNNDNSNFLVSVGALENTGIVPNTDFNRYSYRLNGNIKVSDKVEIGSRLNYIKSNSKNRPSSGYGSESPMYMFTWYGRSVNTESLREYWQRGHEGTEQYNYNYAWHDNPFFTLYENTNGFDKDRILGNINLTADLYKGLTLKVKSGLDYYSDLRESKRAFSTQRFLQGAYREENVKFLEMNTDFLLSYRRDLSEKWNMGVNFGGNRMYQERDFTSARADRLVLPGIYNLRNSALPLVTNQIRTRKQINSLYGTATFAYDHKLYLDITGRNDWSSTLPSNNNSYFYPSLSASLILSEVFELPKSIDFAKVRSSVAQVGNDTDPYRLLNTYQYNTPFAGNRTLTRDDILLNKDLKPEMITSFEIGTDIRMFEDRLSLDLTYYRSTSKDQIMTVPISNTTGYQAQVINAGKIQNEGIEALLRITPIRKKDFEWTTSFNFAKNVGTVLELPESTDGILTTGYASVYGAEGSRVYIQAREGERLGNMYGRKFKRHNGQIVYKDGQPVVEDELQLLGNYNPDFTLGFQNSFSYKNFDFSFLFDLKVGGTLISRTKQIATYAGNLNDSEDRNNYEDIIPDGVKEMPDGTYQQLTAEDAVDWWGYYKPLYNRKSQQETGIVDADYLKLREVKIGYNLPSKMVEKMGVRQVKVSLVGRNLLLFTPGSNEHFDPETLALQGSQIVPGIEDMSLPSSRSLGVNVLVKF